MAATLSVQEELQVPIDRVWNAVKDADILLPKLVPEFISSQYKLEGDGGPGTVRLIQFGPAMPDVTIAKERIDVLDDASHTVTYTVIEGPTDKYSLLRTTIIFTAGADGKSTIASWSVEYEAVGDQGPPEPAMLGALHVFKAVEGYLLSDLAAYT